MTNKQLRHHMNAPVNRSMFGILLAAFLLAGTGIASAPASNAATPVLTGNPSLRLVSPVLTNSNSIDYTFVRTDPGLDDNNYGKGTKIRMFYVGVGSTLNLTYEARDSKGALMKNATIYLLVNKFASCSATKWITTSPESDYAGSNRPNQQTIVRDWCGFGDGVPGWENFYGGETSIPGVTDANGRATWTLTHDYSYSDCSNPAYGELPLCPEPAPLSLTTPNFDTCTVALGCMRGIITASFKKHPRPYAERGVGCSPTTTPCAKGEEAFEDKDLLWIDIVDDSIAPADDIQTVALSAGETAVRVQVTNLQGQPKAGVKVNFSLASGPGDADIDPVAGSRNPDGTVTETTDTQGWAGVNAIADYEATGMQIINAQVQGSNSATRTAVRWLNAPAVTSSAAVTGVARVGQKLTATIGTWTGTSVKMSYQWFACKSGGKASQTVPQGCAAIKGASKSSFTLTKGQKGQFMRVRVVGSNALSSAASISAATGKVG